MLVGIQKGVYFLRKTKKENRKLAISKKNKTLLDQRCLVLNSLAAGENSFCKTNYRCIVLFNINAAQVGEELMFGGEKTQPTSKET